MQHEVPEQSLAVRSLSVKPAHEIPWQLFVLAAIAAAAVLMPAILLGFPKGNDFEFHIPVWIDIRQQWSEHAFSLRWATLAQYGFGQPIFSFYPPLSCLLGAALSLVAGWNAAPALYISVVLVAAGVAMFKLAVRFLPGPHALISALLYECNPFLVFRIYHTSALAEVLAAAFFPLMLLFALGLSRSNRSIAPLAVVFAAIWLTNVPAGIMAAYALAAVLCITAIFEKSPRVLAGGACSMLLAFGLSAFHFVPAIVQQSWINVEGLNNPDLLPENNFLPAWGYDPNVKWFAAILSCILILGLITAPAAAVIALRRRTVCKGACFAAIGLCAVSSVLLFAFSEPAWLYLPKLRLIQFPWRWLLVFQVGLVFLSSVALPRNPRRAWVLCCAHIGASLTLLTVTADWWHPRAGIEMFEKIKKNGGYYGRPEYMPPGIDQNGIWPVYESALVSTRGQGKAAAIRVHAWAASEKRFSAYSESPTRVALRLQYYPAWRIEVNGEVTKPEMDPQNGRMLVQLPAGASSVKVVWGTTYAQKLGWVITLLSTLIGIASRSRNTRNVVSRLITLRRIGFKE